MPLGRATSAARSGIPPVPLTCVVIESAAAGASSEASSPRGARSGCACKSVQFGAHHETWCEKLRRDAATRRSRELESPRKSRRGKAPPMPDPLDVDYAPPRSEPPSSSSRRERLLLAAVCFLLGGMAGATALAVMGAQRYGLAV